MWLMRRRSEVSGRRSGSTRPRASPLASFCAFSSTGFSLPTCSRPVQMSYLVESFFYDKAAQQGSPGLTNSKLACRLRTSPLANFRAFSSTRFSLLTCSRRLELEKEKHPSPFF